MEKQAFDIPLKGERDYIQGPDLFNLAVQTLSEAGEGPADEFELAFHRMAHRQVALVWDTDVAPEDAFAVGSRLRDGQRDRFWMTELAAPLGNRQPYPEDRIVAQMSFDDEFRTARLEPGFAYSDMELWVSMIKAMHQRRFAGADGKWVFVRAKLWTYDPNHAPAVLCAELTATLGTKLTRNVVYLDEQKIGDVFFALM